MLCKKCGAQIPDDSYKCEYCGEVFREEPAPEEIKIEDNSDLGDTKIIDLNEEEETAPEETPQRSTHEIFEENEKKRRSQTEKVIDEKQLQLEEITQRRNQKKQRQKRNKIILVSIACVLVAAAAGAGTYYVRNGGFGSGTIIATPSPSVSPIPSLAPIQTSAVATPQATTETEATERPENSSASGNGSSSNSSSASGNGSSSGSGNSSASGSGSSSGSGNSSASGSGSSSGNSGSSASGNASSSSGTTSSSGNVGSGTTVDTGKYSGAVSENIVSKLVIGNEVIHDGPSDRYFMTFNMNGTMYYANVSKGSTTSQINGKYITITAEPTSGRYDGNTVYEITSMTYYSGDYIIPDSGTKIIDKASLSGMSKDSLGLARNEIYARHGRKFQMEVYQKYFESKSWYKPNPNYDYTDDNKNLNEIELKNVETILSVENSK